MSSVEPPTQSTGIWPPESKDTLPPNIPVTEQPVPPMPAKPRRRFRYAALFVVMVIVLLVGGVAGGVVGVNVIAPRLTGQNLLIHTLTDIGGNPLFDARVQGEPPVPQAPFIFLEAQAAGDGQAMWNQLSPSEQQALSSQGGSPTKLTSLLQQQGKIDVKEITFVGGAMLSDGREACVFVVTANVNGALRQAPYYFTVDTNGKIDEFH
ncbi:MAG: hypothetical protein M1118_14325 [Chloroflexi bacterium]|nr:hypothetical protein [Chloroflexota bacterium]